MVDIKSLDDWIGASRQDVLWSKTVGRTSVATGWFSLFDVAGNPGAGTLAAGNTANGLVPTSAGAGYPTINAFGASAIGRIAMVEFASSVACKIRLYDRVFVAGAYAFNANTALSSQPNFDSRVTFRDPSTDTDAVDYGNLEIWVEQVTAATGNQAVTVTYTNEAGTGSRSTGAVGIGAAPTLGRCWQLPLQAGDKGVQRIDNVQGTVATAGTFNVMLLRRITTGRVRSANDGDVLDMLRTGLPQVFADSALYALVAADSTSTGIPDLMIQVANA